LVVLEGLDGDDRAEDFVLDHLVALLQPDDNRRLDVEAVLALPLPAGRDGGMIGQAVDEAEHALELAAVVDRWHQRVRVEAATVEGRADRTSLLAERGDKLVGATWLPSRMGPVRDGHHAVDCSRR